MYEILDLNLIAYLAKQPVPQVSTPKDERIWVIHNTAFRGLNIFSSAKSRRRQMAGQRGTSIYGMFGGRSD
jgi:hypothetical protein